MHELGIMTGVMEAVGATARDVGADKVFKIRLKIGVMTEVVEDALQFAFEALSANTISEGAELEIVTVQPKSKCLECLAEYEHDRFHRTCPECGSFASELIAGREMQIDSIEVDIPDEEEADAEKSSTVSNAAKTPDGSINKE